jgi:hypothetical protein
MSAGLARADSALHEWTGLIAYWLTGNSSELFPAPRATTACDRSNANDSCKRD